MFGIFKKKEVEWPFDQPKNYAVFSIRQIIERECPIQVVYHDLEDDGWQFVSNIEYTMEDAKLVGLEEITKIDAISINGKNNKFSKTTRIYLSWI